ncbi:MAG: hypothetical protein ACR2RA_21515 [Geminicoccaceae bacterium]
MSIGEQDFGFDPKEPVALGKTIVIQVDIPNLLISGVTSAEWALFQSNPQEQPTQTALVTKTIGAGIALTDGASGLEVLVTLDPGDTSALAVADYYHRLDYVASGGGQHEAARGRARLSARV